MTVSLCLFTLLLIDGQVSTDLVLIKLICSVMELCMAKMLLIFCVWILMIEVCLFIFSFVYDMIVAARQLDYSESVVLQMLLVLDLFRSATFFAVSNSFEFKLNFFERCQRGRENLRRNRIQNYLQLLMKFI